MTLYTSLMHDTNYYDNYAEPIITDEIIKIHTTMDIFYAFMDVVYPDLPNETKSITNFSSYQEEYGNYEFTFEDNTFTFMKKVNKKLKYFSSHDSNGKLEQKGTYVRIVKLKHVNEEMRNVGITYNINGFICKPKSFDYFLKRKHKKFKSDTMREYVKEIGTFEKNTHIEYDGGAFTSRNI